MRLPRLLWQVTKTRVQLLLPLWLAGSVVFYALVPAVASLDSTLALGVSVVLWALIMAATCHAVLWVTRPSLTECLSVSFRALVHTIGLVLIIMLAFFAGLFMLLLPGIAALIFLSLAVPLTMQARPGILPSLIQSARGVIAFWGTALMVAMFSAIIVIAMSLISLLITSFLVEEGLANSPIFDAVFFGGLAMSSGLLGSVFLLAIQAEGEAK